MLTAALCRDQESFKQNTRDRVPAHISIRINEQIQRDIAIRVRHYVHHLDEIPERLNALACEWDIERAIEANASVLAFVGVTLASRDRRWLALPALVTGFLFQHAISGMVPTGSDPSPPRLSNVL